MISSYCWEAALSRVWVRVKGLDGPFSQQKDKGNKLEMERG